MEKKSDTAPQVELILIDNEIALILQSTPPAGPSEGASLAPEYRNDNPFRKNLG